jgi:chemotaxis signal transduction protein
VSSETEFVKGVGKINDKLLILIDINKMMPNTEKMEVPQMSV